MLASLLLLIGGGSFGLLQLRVTQKYIARQAQDRFNKHYKGTLSIGRLDGTLPYRVQLSDVSLALPDSVASDSLPALHIKRIALDLDLWDLLRRQVTITGFRVDQPQIRLVPDGDSLYTLQKALKRKTPADTSGQNLLTQIQIIAPMLALHKGSVYVKRFIHRPAKLQYPEPFRVDSLDMSMFLELSDKQRFLDIENISAKLPQLAAEQVEMNGQVFNDGRFLEFNGFNLFTGRSKLAITGEIEGIDLYKKDLASQFRNARYDVVLDSTSVNLSEFNDLAPRLPFISEPIRLKLDMEGRLDSLWMDEFGVGLGESWLQVDGLAQHLLNRNQLKYRVHVSNTVLRKQDMEVLTGRLSGGYFEDWESFKMEGRAQGTLDSARVNLDLASSAGKVTLAGGSSLKPPYRYDATLNARSLDLGKVLASRFKQTNLNMDLKAKGVGLDVENGVSDLSAEVFNSTINGVDVEKLDITASLVDGFLEPHFVMQNGSERLNGDGWIDLAGTEPLMNFSGKGNEVDVARLFKTDVIPSTELNLDYNVELQGNTLDRLYGRASLDIHPSVIGGDSVRAHQIYMDLDSPDLDTRHLRLTSSLFDMDISGRIEPSRILRMSKHWSSYLRQRFHKEILLDSLRVPSFRLPARDQDQTISLTVNAEIKDIGLIKNYWPEFPYVLTQTKLDANINADGQRLLLTAGWKDRKTQINNVVMENPDAQLTASFRYNQTLKEFSSVDLTANIGRMQVKTAELEDVGLNFSMKKDSITYSHHVGRFSKDARFTMAFNALLSDTAIVTHIQDFNLGNQEYTWHNKSNPKLTFTDKHTLRVQDFTFQNDDQFLELAGTFGPSRRDSVLYIARNVDLQRISELVNGRIHFQGIMNATFATKSLSRQPSIQGDINVDRFALDNRPVGDVTFRSRYNPQQDRFNTSIRVLTDSTKYASYVKKNDGIRQDIAINGYFIPPDPNLQQDKLFQFDVNFNEIDMWVLPYVVPHIFNKVEGRATGKGQISGNLKDYDFHADFQVHDVYANPMFLNTDYWLNGHVALDREDGVVFDDIDVSDHKGGHGTFFGSVDLNDFQPLKYLDISLRLDNLEFLNNDFDPDVPFYGSLYGTGLLHVKGPNNSPYLSTDVPIQVSSDSRLSIPLLDETQVSKDNKFIRFVKDFDLKKDEELRKKDEAKNGDQFVAPSEKSFTELFDLDLQFVASRQMSVQLIFDPVTGEVLNAQGTGQMNITLEDQDVRMFGRFDVSGGEYQFVSGDIFTRKFSLEDGGSITWEGDPDNARLDVSAVYRARPDITTILGGASTVGSDQQQNIQRIPVELVLQIQGTLNSLENNFYFRLPNTMEVSQNAALVNRINRLNADNEQKLLQATSLLLTGNFIPVSTPSGESNTRLRENLTSSAVVLNPLLSNQVLSPLLSNQINALLNSDISSFDIDFNLNAYNQIDLGIALRLYNDRIILRREGQITGPQGNIGDLGATFRINRALSVTAFHRQDPTLSTISSTQAQTTEYLNGVGLEAQVHFNTWKELKRRFVNAIRRFFGAGKKQQDDEQSQKATEAQTEPAKEN